MERSTDSRGRKSELLKIILAGSILIALTPPLQKIGNSLVYYCNTRNLIDTAYNLEMIKEDFLASYREAFGFW